MRQRSNVLPILLAFCLLAVGSMAVEQAVAHDFFHHRHSGHQHASHNTILCSWLCDVGQGWEIIAAFYAGERFPSSLLEFPGNTIPSHLLSVRISARGPPLT